MKNIDFDANLSFNSPIGSIGLYSKDNRVVRLTIGGDTVASRGRAKVLDDAHRQLSKFFAGKAKELTFDVALSGTDFQEAVWNAIAQIDYGQSVSYADIARSIGNPKAVRAVGAAVGANPVPLRIACHRVLGSNGSITGYSAGEGVATKRWLLQHEGLLVAD